MVDPIGLKPVLTSDRKVAEVTRIAPATAPQKATSQDEIASQTITTAQQIAAKAPVDQERVARIRKAIENGTFPIVPAQIADRLIAAKLDWVRNDPR